MNKQQLIIGSIVVMVVIVGAFLLIQTNQSTPSPYTSPAALSDEEMELTDVGAELETLDTDFDTDLQKLDAELKGI